MATPTVAASSVLLAAGVKRLLHDLKEVLENPLPNVSCMPLEDDLYTWHGNVRSSSSSTLQGAPIHFLVQFPPNYPQSPPEFRVFHPIPHPNVQPVTGTIQVLHVNNSSSSHQQHVDVSRVAGGQLRPLPRQARWRLAMYDCIPGKSAWSSAYSVLSVMLHLQVFLMDEDLLYAQQQVTPEAAIAKALEFDCPLCSHTGSSVYPPFASEADVAAAKQNKAKTAVQKPFCPARSRTTALQLRQHQRQKAVCTYASPGAPKNAGSSCSSGSVGLVASSSSNSCSTPVSCTASPSRSSGSSIGASCDTPTSSSSSSCSQSVADGWLTVKGKGSKGLSKQGTAVTQSGAAAAAVGDGGQHGGCSRTAGSSSSSRFSVLKYTAKDASVDIKQQQHHSKHVQLQQQQQQGPLSKASKKNLARSWKRQQQQKLAGSAAASSSNVSISTLFTSHAATAAMAQPTTRTSTKPMHQPQQQQAADWVEVGSRKKEAVKVKQQRYSSPLQQLLQQLEKQPMHQLIQQCLQGASPAVSATNTTAITSSLSTSSSSTAGNSSGGCASDLPFTTVATISAAATAAAGPLGQLPRDAMLCVLCLLQPADVAALTCTCRVLHAACEDGALWQTLMVQSFPCHSLQASNMQGWKVAYQLESAALLDELRCFYTRSTHDEDVLGLPLTFSVNPVTKRVDYILAHPDLLSVTAFKAGVRHTPHQEFGALLPLYLTTDHFNRALPHMEPLLKLLAPELVPRGGGCPPATAWLDVLPKVLNTQVVLLADNGIAASQRSLAVSCQVYRLLLAVCEHWCLWPDVSTRLDSFLLNPQKRTKAAAPNLGLLLPLLSCSPVRHSWPVMSAALLEESFDRKVLWMCKKDLSLVEAFKSPRGSGANLEFIRSAWAGAAVSCKLMAFHLVFLQLVASPKGSSLEGVMDAADAFYGWPAAALGSRFSKAVKHIQQVSGWKEWFAVLGRVPPTTAAMTDLLRSAWQRSLVKGYHKKDTDFSKVHASGVSRILLKGQSYSMPPGTKTVELEVHYKWHPQHSVRYLDGAVLLFGPGRMFLEMVAWNNQSSRKTAHQGAVTQSGDIMQFEQQSGKNLATIRLSELGPNVTEAFITLSAWSDAMLSDIIQPYVQLFEPSTGVELCQVHLDSKELAVKRAHKCVILARMFKEASGGWGVQSVGGFCQGNTGSFGQLDRHASREGLGGMVAGIKALAE